MPKGGVKLTEKQKKFCELYAATGNGYQSAIDAGYSKNVAAEMASLNLRKPKLIEYLKKITKRKTERRISTAEERQEWLTNLAEGVIDDSHVTATGDVIGRPAKLSDRIRAAELLAKMRGELLDKHQIDGEIRLTRIKKRYDGD